MEENGKQIAEMQNAAGIGAALIELGGERPAYARDLVTLCKGAVEQGVQLDAAIAALAEMAAGEQLRATAEEVASKIDGYVSYQVDELFRAAMMKAIEHCAYFSLQQLAGGNEIFDQLLVDHFGFEIASCHKERDDTFVLVCVVVNNEREFNPFSEVIDQFEARFSNEYNYDQAAVWSECGFESCFEGIALNNVLSGVVKVKSLAAMKEWIRRDVTFVRLSRD